MLPLIENQVSITKPFFLEWRKSGRNPSYKKNMRIISIAAIVILACALGFFYSQGMPTVMLIGEFIFISAIFLWIVVFLPRSRVKKQYKALRQSANGDPKRIARFYQNSFSVTTESGKVTEFSYHKVQAIRETEHLYVLSIDEAEIDVILDKKGFRKGDMVQIRQLIAAAG